MRHDNQSSDKPNRLSTQYKQCADYKLTGMCGGALLARLIYRVTIAPFWRVESGRNLWLGGTVAVVNLSLRGCERRIDSVQLSVAVAVNLSLKRFNKVTMYSGLIDAAKQSYFQNSLHRFIGIPGVLTSHHFPGLCEKKSFYHRLPAKTATQDESYKPTRFVFKSLFVWKW